MEFVVDLTVNVHISKNFKRNSSIGSLHIYNARYKETLYFKNWNKFKHTNLTSDSNYQNYITVSNSKIVHQRFNHLSVYSRIFDSITQNHSDFNQHNYINAVVPDIIILDLYQKV